MAAISTYLADKYLDCLGNATGFNVASVYVQLHTADPGTAGTTAVAGNSTRKQISWAAAASESKAASADVTWTNVSTAETYSHISLWDASTAGNFLWAGALTAAKAVNAGDTFTLTAANLTVALS